jgi:integration host factor subunit alpha
MALKKNDIVERFQAELGFTKSKSIQITECLLELIKASLESSDDVLVAGFGKFCVKEKMGRRGRNPATGEEMMLEPQRVVTFKWSGKLRKRVNGGVYLAQSERRPCCLNILKKDNVMYS